jgi:transcriptional regulator NrdR family protein
MKCLRCESATGVVTTYQNENGVTRRRRECLRCAFRFTTREGPDPKDVERAKTPDAVRNKLVPPGLALQNNWLRK